MEDRRHTNYDAQDKLRILDFHQDKDENDSTTITHIPTPTTKKHIFITHIPTPIAT
jgi:hypothetical protein